MVSIKSLATVAAAAGLFSLASASPTIGSLSTPSTAKNGSTITATLKTSSYIQNWEDFSIIWGIANAQHGGQGSDGVISVGQQIAYTTLYGNDMEKLPSFEVDIKIPENQPAGEWLIVAAVPYLVGISGEMGLNAFNSSIKIST